MNAMVISSWTGWLPPQAMTGALLLPRLGDTLAGWCARWFSRGSFDADGGFGQLESKASAAPDDADTRFREEGLAMILSQESRIAIAGLMLDRPLTAPDLSPSDRKVAAVLVDRAVEDLCRGLSGLFGLPATGAWRRGEPVGPRFRHLSQIELRQTDGAAAIVLVVATDLLVGAIKAAAASTLPAPALGSIGGALASQEVSLSAFLGPSEMTLGDLADLAIGDIVLLDTPSAAPLPIALDGVPTSGRCRLEQGETGLGLKILNSPA
ncbi:FliM/FliN family flagellar motor C-terminal domain-containing protein [Allosphingosinicella deserti]|uniref:Flagellar motor switch protein FliN-like C-terminal domain-containing protein n=1 Tax=Allosphingosinicella deserti TaxID=2116704 RepID=A0A2P7QW70_9SPHN|nr:FliM/FliN family flagellar motor C-terminal domain-containing protein [Sphingomonas deserti]PSJ42200.1 hypothetical protein C7I55_08175 [Sphingomonas deserti]